MARRRTIHIEAGMKHGHLTVTKFVGYSEDAQRNYECKCDCGNTVVLRATRFSPSRKYCSRHCTLLSKQRIVDLTGKKFGRWTVLKRAGFIDKAAAWKCICECGTESIQRGGFLNTGQTKSCGCLNRDIITKYKTPDEKLAAKRRNSRVCAHKNPARMKANKIKYERRLSRATPKWLNETHWAEMNALYEEARRLTKKTGVKHQVDHIVPLNGENVSGLHVPWNLQILTQSENVSKSNRYAELSGD